MADPSSTALVALGGTLPEKVEAYKTIAAAQASLALNGYDTVPKCMAGAWAADALGVHPVAFMQNVYLMTVGGKVMLEPRWELISALLRSRLPGFDFKIIERSDKAAEVEMRADGREPQRVRYATADAARQGLANKDTYKNNPVEMLWKQAFKKCADLIGSDVILGLPSLQYEDAAPAAEPPQREPSGAEVVEDGPAPEPPTTHAGVAPKSKPAPKPAPKSAATPIGETLMAEIKRVFGIDRKENVRGFNAKAIEFLWSLAPENKAAFPSPANIGPVQMQQMVEALAKMPDFGTTGGSTEAAATDGTPVMDFKEQHAVEHEVAATDPSEIAPEIPAMDEVAEDVPPPADFEGPRVDGLSWEEFNVVVVKERKRLGTSRPIVKEAPAKSGRWYLTDPLILKDLGYDASLCLMRDGAVQIAPGELSRIARVTTEHGDKAEAAKGRK